MIALGLIGVLLGGVLAFGWTLADRRASVVDGVRESLATSGVFDRIEADLAAAVAGDDVLGAGVKGDATSLRILSRGVWLTGPEQGEAAGPAERSAEDGQPGPAKAELSDLIGVEYRFSAGSAAMAAPTTGASGGVGVGRLTVRRWLAEAGASPPAEEALVSDRVARLRLRYFDGQNWSDSFDSLAAGGLPAAIEIALWTRAPAAVSASPAPQTGGPAGLPAGAGGLSAAEPARADPGFPDQSQPNLGPPDRLRVIAIPDGGAAGAPGALAGERP